MRGRSLGRTRPITRGTRTITPRTITAPDGRGRSLVVDHCCPMYVDDPNCGRSLPDVRGRSLDVRGRSLPPGRRYADDPNADDHCSPAARGRSDERGRSLTPWYDHCSPVVRGRSLDPRTRPIHADDHSDPRYVDDPTNVDDTDARRTWTIRTRTITRARGRSERGRSLENAARSTTRTITTARRTWDDPNVDDHSTPRYADDPNADDHSTPRYVDVAVIGRRSSSSSGACDERGGRVDHSRGAAGPLGGRLRIGITERG